MRRRNFIKGFALGPAAAVAAAGAARPSSRAKAARDLEPVDLELVLAVDVSSSISSEEMELQFQGYAAAFNAPDLARRVGTGPIGAIACTLFAWSDPDHQQVLVPWMLIDGAATAQAFAVAIDAAPRMTGLYTSISGAIDFAAGLFGRGGFEGTRRIVDISGDGADNAVRPGRSLAQARNDALDRGIVLNGLAILDADPPRTMGNWPTRRVPPLDEYYRDAVIGGAGSFLVVAEGFEAFGPAVRRKLAREIADAVPRSTEPRIERVAA
jgi:Protein of unknown function (DUF1194)